MGSTTTARTEPGRSDCGSSRFAAHLQSAARDPIDRLCQSGPDGVDRTPSRTGSRIRLGPFGCSRTGALKDPGATVVKKPGERPGRRA